jgi:putative transposase
MKRARFTEEQIIGVLKEHDAGAKTADLRNPDHMWTAPWQALFA